MNRTSEARTGGFKPVDCLKITVLGFATTALWQAMHTVILPLRLLDFVPEADKNTYLGVLTFTGLLLATFIQPIAGAISDSSASGFGRRRPFIAIGVILMLLFLPGIGLAGSYAAIFVVYCLLQISSNTVQGPYQGLIPDLVPAGKRGLASGVKSLVEITGGAIAVLLISVFMDRYSAGDGKIWLWLSLAIPGAVLFALMLYTLAAVREKPCERSAPASLASTILGTFRISFRSNRVFIWFLVSRALIFMAFSTLQQFALYFLEDVIGVASPAAAAATFSVVAVAGMLIAVYPAGRLSDKIGRRPVGIASGVLMALAMLMILFTRQYGVVLAAAGLIGAAVGAFTSANWALATDLVVKGEEARYLGLANMATAGGGALSRLIGPVITFFNGVGPNMGYRAMLIACFVYCVLGAFILFRLKPASSSQYR